MLWDGFDTNVRVSPIITSIYIPPKTTSKTIVVASKKERTETQCATQRFHTKVIPLKALDQF